MDNEGTLGGNCGLVHKQKSSPVESLGQEEADLLGVHGVYIGGGQVGEKPWVGLDYSHGNHHRVRKTVKLEKCHGLMPEG